MPPGKKSICCRNFSDGVRLGEGLGTLKGLPKALISLVGHFEGGSSEGKMAKNCQKGPKRQLFKEFQKSKILLIAMSLIGWLGSRDVGVQN